MRLSFTEFVKVFGEAMRSLGEPALFGGEFMWRVIDDAARAAARWLIDNGIVVDGRTII